MFELQITFARLMDPEQEYLLTSKKGLHHVDTHPATLLGMIISIFNFKSTLNVCRTLRIQFDVVTSIDKMNGRKCTNDTLKEWSSYKKLLVYQPRYSAKRRGHRSRGHNYACQSKWTLLLRVDANSSDVPV